MVHTSLMTTATFAGLARSGIASTGSGSNAGRPIGREFDGAAFIDRRLPAIRVAARARPVPGPAPLGTD